MAMHRLMEVMAPCFLILLRRHWQSEPGDVHSTTFSIHNTGDAPLLVDEVYEENNSTPLTMVGLSFPLSIPAGGSTNFTVSFEVQSALAFGDMVVRSNDPDTPLYRFAIAEYSLLIPDIYCHASNLNIDLCRGLYSYWNLQSFDRVVPISPYNNFDPGPEDLGQGSFFYSGDHPTLLCVEYHCPQSIPVRRWKLGQEETGVIGRSVDDCYGEPGAEWALGVNSSHKPPCPAIPRTHDLVLTKATVPGSVTASNATFRLVVDNAGPHTALGAVLRDFMRPGAFVQTPPSNVVLHLRLDESPGTNGTVLVDDSGLGRDGSLVDGNATFGLVAGALDLLGSGDYFEVPAFDLSENCTLSCWFKPNSLSGRRTLIGKHDAGGTNQLLVALDSGEFEVQHPEQHDAGHAR